jgi:uncharacterized membrane protein YphA (DoxX/SURF4 family)
MGKLNYTLWTAQILLALMFLFAGVMKFFVPAEQAAGPYGFPLWFIWFIGIAEIAGAIGLLLPGLLKRNQLLTPLAAAGLVIIMIGAVVTSLPMGIAVATIPLVIGLIAAFVAYGRWKLEPLAPQVKQ